jgi:hypothetical protein
MKVAGFKIDIVIEIDFDFAIEIDTFPKHY